LYDCAGGAAPPPNCRSSSAWAALAPAWASLAAEFEAGEPAQVEKARQRHKRPEHLLKIKSADLTLRIYSIFLYAIFIQVFLQLPGMDALGIHRTQHKCRRLNHE
jgi:hypothetical protein